MWGRRPRIGSQERSKLENTEMETAKYRKLKRAADRRSLAVILTPAFLLVLFFNFHGTIVDLSGIYTMVCLESHDTKMQLGQDILHFVLPKLSNHCTTISLVQLLNMMPSGYGDLLVVLNLAILAVVPLTSIYFVYDYKAHKELQMQHFVRRAAHIRYYRVRLVVFAIGLICLSCWFVLFAPIEIRPTGTFSALAHLMADYGFGVFFHSLCASLLPYGVTIALASVPILTDRKGRLQFGTGTDDDVGKS